MTAVISLSRIADPHDQNRDTIAVASYSVYNNKNTSGIQFFFSRYAFMKQRFAVVISCDPLGAISRWKKVIYFSKQESMRLSIGAH